MAVPSMDWTYPAGSGDAGLFEIGRRLAEALGHAPDVTRFTYDPRDMLRTTRQIEGVARGGRLLVGFQTAAKLKAEASRYADLLDGGTSVTVWAVGPRPDDAGLATLEYVQAGNDRGRLEAQWFLVTDDPEPLAFVSYELGDPANFGIGGAATPGKRFVGFVSDDPDVVKLLVAALGPKDAQPAMAPQAELSVAARELVRLGEAAEVASTGAADGSVVVAVGRGADRDAFLAGFAIAAREGRRLVLVDRSAEGFSSPYGDLRGDDLGRPSPDRLFDDALARREGREWIGTYLEAAAAAGVTAGGWFPTHSGGEGLAEAARRFSGALIVLPPGADRPTLAERLRGVLPDQLRVSTGLPVLVAALAS